MTSVNSPRSTSSMRAPRRMRQPKDADPVIALGDHSRGLKAPSRRRSASKGHKLSLVSSTKVSTAKPPKTCGLLSLGYQRSGGLNCRVICMRSESPAGLFSAARKDPRFSTGRQGFHWRPLTNQPLACSVTAHFESLHTQVYFRETGEYTNPDINLISHFSNLIDNLTIRSWSYPRAPGAGWTKPNAKSGPAPFGLRGF